MVRVGVGVGEGHDHDAQRTDETAERHDSDGEQEPHADDGDEDSPAQEALLPFAAQATDVRGVHEGVVEGQRHLEDGQQRHDQQRLHVAGQDGVHCNESEDERRSDGCEAVIPPHVDHSPFKREYGGGCFSLCPLPLERASLR